MKLVFDEESATVSVTDRGVTQTHALDNPEAFRLVSQAWVRAGWDVKYVYGFSWLGRPIIQLPDDLMRIQEVIWSLQPDVIIETGVAHGGSLVFYASLCQAMGRGQVIGIDIDLRAHNLHAIQNHPLARFITLIQGSSVDPPIVQQVKNCVPRDAKTLILLDSNHAKDHVLAELEAYGPLVSVGSYIVATDGIMQDLVGAPRSREDWGWNNPQQAAESFVQSHPEFVIEEPIWPFNEGSSKTRVTYWPRAFIRRTSRGSHG